MGATPAPIVEIQLVANCSDQPDLNSGYSLVELLVVLALVRYR
jgi:hypothetical protein